MSKARHYEECAQICEERGAAYRNAKAPGWHEVDHESAQCAAAIRGAARGAAISPGWAWNKSPDVPPPAGPVLVTSASKCVWVADFAASENVWRVGSGRDMVKLPPEAITHWTHLPVAAGLDGVNASDETRNNPEN